MDGQTLVLNGAALRTLTVLKVRIYIVALYLPRKMRDPAAILAAPGPKVALVHYIHSGTKEQVQDRFRTGEKNNCGDGSCDKSLEPDFERLVSAAEAVEPGDTTAFAVTSKGLQVSFNGRPFQSFGKPALGNQIINGFIGPHAPTAEFRATLLGLPAP
jgi:Chalcone isomerase-like